MNPEDILKKTKPASLRPAEKEVMRRMLVAHMDTHPLPLAGRVMPAFARFIPGRLAMNGLAGFLMLLLLGGGVSYAAEGSLPGDTLYSLKVNVTEEIRAMLATNTEAKADWNVRRVERRLEEAETLAAQGKLSEKASAELSAKFEAQVAKVASDVEAMRGKHQTTTLSNMSSNFEASLGAHAEILTRIANNEGAKNDKIEPLLTKVRANLKTSRDSRTKIDDDVKANTDTRMKASAEMKLKEADNKIQSVQKFIVKNKKTVSDGGEARAKMKLEEASKAVAEGKAKISAGASSEAFVFFQQAGRFADEAQLLATSEKSLKLEAGFSLFGKNNGKGNDSATSSPTTTAPRATTTPSKNNQYKPRTNTNATSSTSNVTTTPVVISTNTTTTIAATTTPSSTVTQTQSNSSTTVQVGSTTVDMQTQTTSTVEATSTVGL